MKAIPEGYEQKLDLRDTERAIKLVKDTFQWELASNLNLQRVSAPRFLEEGTGLQDDLAGTQEPVGFYTHFTDERVEMVHSLAKWKRQALARYGFKPGEGLYTDMDAVRKDENPSPIHSVYVDQWDWERIMRDGERTPDYLKGIVDEIYDAIRATEERIVDEFPVLEPRLTDSIKLVHTEELERQYPEMTPEEREEAVAREHGAVFLMGIGYDLPSGEPHDLRAADYDDWSTPTERGRGLNGDIIVWDPTRDTSLELSSMGIRVDPEAMQRQLSIMDLEERVELPFHRGVIEGEIPQTIGGGIGQSRLCMLLLHKAHIGEVQSSVWPDYVEEEFRVRGVDLL